jgi:hypothetical protein
MNVLIRAYVEYVNVKVTYHNSIAHPSRHDKEHQPCSVYWMALKFSFESGCIIQSIPSASVTSPQNPHRKINSPGPPGNSLYVLNANDTITKSEEA